MQGGEFLAIWSDVEASKETDYLHWLTREHTAERVGVKGFLATRVFRALDTDIRRFFILYELEGPEVLSRPDYLARLDAPTPWSQRIMPLLGNFVRGGGRQVASTGTGQGGVIAAVPLREAQPPDGQACRRPRKLGPHCRRAPLRARIKQKRRSRRERKACACRIGLSRGCW